MTHAQNPSIRTADRHSPASDEATTRLALAARNGNPEKADLFVRALHRDVWRYVAHLSADIQAADDLTQDVFLRAFISLPAFEGRSSARTWLLSIARRTVVDTHRRAASRPKLADRSDWQSAAERAQPCDLPGFDEGVALMGLLSEVPAERQEAFLLTQVLGLSYAEAAKAVGCPIGTVRSRVARARSSLIELLMDEVDEDNAAHAPALAIRHRSKRRADPSAARPLVAA
ncbi:sigma-70 family RNA polymerase sigma factor [[Kitasatospora] papulosa]|uniref:sigma-70 family RNA polymerase sigma factor n=1 Tax=Streptomyces TaxID=1883 RepID=UPI00341474A6